jgi:hypothetical protein
VKIEGDLFNSPASPFCRLCGQKIEWHPTKAGNAMALDPDPHPAGRFAFDNNMRLVTMPPGSKPRMYRCHFDTCPNKETKAPRRAAFVCDVDACDLTSPHLHCFKCGSTSHLARVCEEESE